MANTTVFDNTEKLEAAIKEKVQARVKEAIFQGIKAAFDDFGMSSTPTRSPSSKAKAPKAEAPKAEAQRAPATSKGPKQMKAKRRSRRGTRGGSAEPAALTEIQEETLRMIQDYMKDKGESPTYTEIADALNKTGVATTVYAIAKKGWIDLDPSKNTRKIEILHSL